MFLIFSYVFLQFYVSFSLAVQRPHWWHRIEFYFLMLAFGLDIVLAQKCGHWHETNATAVVQPRREGPSCFMFIFGGGVVQALTLYQHCLLLTFMLTPVTLEESDKSLSWWFLVAPNLLLCFFLPVHDNSVLAGGVHSWNLRSSHAENMYISLPFTPSPPACNIKKIPY